MQEECTMINYAFFYLIYIESLLNFELRLLSYEIKHFIMLFKQIKANIILNILNMDEKGILWNYTKF